MWAAYGLELKLYKGVITVADHWQHSAETGIVPKDLSKQVPYILVVDGKGILHKPVTTNASATPTERLREAMPGVASKDFYLQVTPGVETDFLSLIRCDTFDQFWNDWQAAGYWVVGVTLGPWVSTLLASITTSTANGQAIPSGNHLLETRQGKPLRITVSVNQEQDAITIGEEQFNRMWVPAYAAGVSWLLTGSINPSPTIETVRQRQVEWKHRKRFETTGKGVLAGVFLLLLLNFITFGHLRKKIETVEAQVSRSSASSEKENEMLRQMKQKKKFLEQNGWLHNTHHSFFADTLAASLPEGIRLLELSINPKDEKQSREEKRLVFVPTTITIKGICASPGPLQDWMYRLGRSRWVADLSQPSYQFDPQLKAGVFNFTLLVKPGL
jgi:hypothetical protein